uniref:Uncharacterized protein n=1 Tax=Cajanus cajan TaxID=3821 RepID=A0A151TSZ4_CAJCA|nr:hypothetical protein KK1_009334 [Cajanus cajan]
MGVPKLWAFFLLVIVLLSLTQDSTSRLDTNEELKQRSVRKVSADRSSLKFMKISNSKQVKEEVDRKVPSGPNPIHHHP